MAWLQFSLPADTDTVDTWSDVLMDNGAVSVSLENENDEALYELNPTHKPMWQKVQLIALYKDEIDPLVMHQILAQFIDPEVLKLGVWTTFEDQDWVRKSQDNMQPMSFGNNLWVCPSWSVIPDPNAINIMLDPEMAFGTGAHATTALCLEWLAQNIKPEQTVVDYGCGSGILGLAAAKLGASKVYLTDIDPLALEISLANAEKNSVDMNIFRTFMPEDMPAVTVDVVVANILAQPLMGLAPTLAEFLQPGGRLVLSGILEEQNASIVEHYSQWFDNLEVRCKDLWCLITATKK